MRLSWIKVGFTIALLASTSCSIPGADKADDSGAPAAADAKVHFEREDTLTLAPGETREVRVLASPAASYGVRFALIGDALDGWLESAEGQSDASGLATMVLHAPSEPTTFHLRASIVLEDGQAGPSAETSVAVSAQGFGTVRVLPQYAGKRAVTTWTASVVARTTCEKIGVGLPSEPEGALVASSDLGTPPQVPHAPVGPNLAVAVRAGHYAWGCADTSDLTADGTLDIKVTLVDKPIDLGATDLDLTLGYPTDAADYADLISGVTHLFRSAFLPDGAVEAGLVLTAMGAAAPLDQTTAFTAARAAQGWDALASAHFAALDQSLRDRASSWIAAGLPLQASTIVAHLGAKAGSPGVAELHVLTIGGIDGAAAGVPPAIPLSWTSDPDDTLILGGLVIWQPSRFIGGAALAGARLEHPAATTMASVLAEAADCPGLAAKLSGFGACDAGCLAALCEKALGDRWALGLGASTAAGQIGQLTLTASGPAQIDDAARPLGFKGIWIGTLSNGVASAKLKGSFEGATPQAVSPP
jgi:hypothetical protein